MSGPCIGASGGGGGALFASSCPISGMLLSNSAAVTAQCAARVFNMEYMVFSSPSKQLRNLFF
jgi:hypothetical protein